MPIILIAGRMKGEEWARKDEQGGGQKRGHSSESEYEKGKERKRETGSDRALSPEALFLTRGAAAASLAASHTAASFPGAPVEEEEK